MPSKAYDAALAEATAHHASSKTYSGKFLRPHKPFLSAMIERLWIKSALDYGAGKGLQYEWVDPEDGFTLEQAWGFTVTKFDPAWPPFAEEPSQVHDLVLCTHALSCIPTQDLAWAIGRLYELASKAVYVAEKLGKVKKKPSSDPTVFPKEWPAARWLELFEPHARAALERQEPCETILCFRERTPEGVIVTRHQFTVEGWEVITFPPAT